MLEAQPLIFVRVSVTDRPSCPIASSVRIVLVFVRRSTLTLRAVTASFSLAISDWRTGFSPALNSLRALPRARTSSVRFRRFASTSLDGRSTFDNAASVIVATTFPAKLSMRTIATSARIAATITRIAVALISASRSSPGSRHSFAEIRFRSGSDKNASYHIHGTGVLVRRSGQHMPPFASARRGGLAVCAGPPADDTASPSGKNTQNMSVLLLPYRHRCVGMPQYGRDIIVEDRS